MTEGLDEGPILASTAVSLDPLETSGSLHERLAAAGAPLIVETLDRLRRGSVAERSQSSGEATYAKKIRPSEPRLRWADSAERVDRLIRGLSPLPGGWFTASIRNAPFRIKALLSRWETGVGEPGEILDDAFLVACGSGAVRILRAQREGRAARDAAEFLRGFPLGPADRLG
jgi:methionyl-tRNA formyltransferase